jgi:hypothetical protein
MIAEYIDIEIFSYVVIFLILLLITCSGISKGTGGVSGPPPEDDWFNW